MLRTDPNLQRLRVRSRSRMAPGNFWHVERIMKRLLVFLLMAAVTLAHANDSKISPDLRNQPSNQQVQVIVQYAPGTQVNCSGLLGLVDCLVNDIVKLGGAILGQLPLVNGVVALLDGSGIVNLSNQSNVVYISQDRPLQPSLNNAAAAVNAEYAWQSNYTGAGIGVALIDSGISNHPDLYQGILPFSRVVYQHSFVPGNSNADDQFGHGTHIAGLIAGDGLSSTGFLFTKTFKGIAPGANIVNLRVLDGNGEATDSEVIAAINQAITMKSTYHIRVINLSLGRAIYETYKLRSAYARLSKRRGKAVLLLSLPRAITDGISRPMAMPRSRRRATIRMFSLWAR